MPLLSSMKSMDIFLLYSISKYRRGLTVKATTKYSTISPFYKQLESTQSWSSRHRRTVCSGWRVCVVWERPQSHTHTHAQSTSPKIIKYGFISFGYWESFMFACTKGGYWGECKRGSVVGVVYGKWVSSAKNNQKSARKGQTVGSSILIVVDACFHTLQAADSRTNEKEFNPA